MIPLVNVRNLPKNVSREELISVMRQFGNILEARIDVNYVTDRSLGTGSVRFETQDSSNRAKQEGKINIRGQEVILDM